MEVLYECGIIQRECVSQYPTNKSLVYAFKICYQAFLVICKLSITLQKCPFTLPTLRLGKFLGLTYASADTMCCSSIFMPC
mmetsp:Transcript_76358/g.127216  ORF Transcript_76358/g.127216 Transcript_76358/m.127216 type:complete len:81 (-) Transcript_76358:196-438(-)